MKELLQGNEAIARGAYEAGIQVATGYPGTPSSEILKTIALKFNDSIYAEWSTNEKVAMDAAAGAAYSGKRTLVTTKQVGMNVMSDSLLYTVYTGAEAGLVIVTADDPGFFSTQNEQDNRWYGKLAKIPILEPQDSQEAKDFVVKGIELSEEFDTPVLVRTTMRTSHSKSVVELGERDNVDKSLDKFPRNQRKYVMTAQWAEKRHPIVEERLDEMREYATDSPLNFIDWGKKDIGIITSAVNYTYAKDVFPEASFLKLGMTYPLSEKLIKEFADEVERVLVIEELDPFLQETIQAMGIEVTGKEIFPKCGELLPDDIFEYIEGTDFEPQREIPQPRDQGEDDLPERSPVLCPGCPHRSSFHILAEMDIPVAGDIGCYNLGCLPPFNAQHTMGCMGASIGVLHGMSLGDLDEPAVATIGDSTFFHSGMPPLANMMHNHGDGTAIIMDNRTTAMTGHQDHPGITQTLGGEETEKIDIEEVVRAMGVEKVEVVDAFNVDEVREALKECNEYDGPAVLITEGECVQITSEKAQEAYEVNPEECIACGKCLDLGCPSIVKTDEEYKDTGRFKAGIDPVLCVGSICDVCRQVCPTGAIKAPNETEGE
ncbi:indolepyruvate ferredoxin oxidoreductase subunit alpha [Candidatus Bipolaricaulota bacterium]|nr:indolepyruvate ferredoxin oxidoreductase subunit alpha [Candidatus Bipolaricaulota bacterium]